MRKAPVLSKLAVPLAIVSIVLCAASSASADPVTRVVAPGAAGIDCSVQQPCSYAYATSVGSNAGDTVLVMPGTYDVSAAPVDLTHRLTIVGDPDQPRPVFTTSDPNQTTMTVENSAGGTVLKHLDIRATGAFEGLRANGRVEGYDLAVFATFRCAMFFSAGSILQDSTLTAEPGGGSQPLCLDSAGASTFSRLTVKAPTGTGVYLEFGGNTLEDSTVTALNALRLSGGVTDNTIARVSLSGTDYALQADMSGRARVTDSVITSSSGTAAVNAFFNGTALHLRNDTIVATGTGASGIRAAAASGTLSAAQIDARNVIVRAAGPDLSAEVAADPASCTPSPCASGALSVDHSAFGDSDGPLLDGGANVAADPAFVNAGGGDFRLTPGSPAIDAGLTDALTQGIDRDGHPRFQGGGLDLGAYEATPVPPQADPSTPLAPGADGPAPTAQPAITRDLRAPVLSGFRIVKRVFRYRLSETATVKIEVARRSAGKRYRPAFTLKRAGHTGANSARSRHLKAGVYRATIVARDAAGNKSRKLVLKFRIRG
jgi:hypothetical protein